MRLLVIGNGFDIAHGLKTSYSDFLDFCIGDENARDFSEKDRELLELLHSKNPSLKYRMKANPWVKYFIKRRKEIGQNWVDFEREIKNVCEIASNEIEEDTVHNVYLDDRGVCFFAHNQKLFNIEYMKSKLVELIEMLNFYLCQLETLPINCQYEQILDFGPTHVINFNYTSTFLKQYCSNINIDFVHGKTSLNKNSIVLGFDTLNSLEEDVKFAEFLKYFQMVNNDIEMNIHLNPEYHYAHTYIFGHSLDKTDEDIIKNIIDGSEKITLLFHSAGHKIQMIKNLIDIYGKTEFNELCLSQNKRIYFEKQESPIKSDKSTQKTNHLFLKIIGRTASKEEKLKFFAENHFSDIKTNENNWCSIADALGDIASELDEPFSRDLVEYFLKKLELFQANVRNPVVYNKLQKCLSKQLIDRRIR